MKKFVRPLAVVLAASLALTGFSACSNKTKSQTSGSSEQQYDFKGMTITYASTYIDESKMVPGINSDTDKLLNRKDEVEKKYNCNIVFKHVDAATYWDNMATTIMSGEPFGDLMEAVPWYIGSWIEAGAVMDVSTLAKNTGVNFNDGSWSQLTLKDLTYGNAVYGFSRKRNTLQLGCLYNKKLLKSAGLTDPNELIASGKKWDFATFEDYAKKLVKFDSDGEISQYGVGTTCKDTMLAGLIMSNGGSIVNESGAAPQLALNDSKSLAAMEVYNNMLNTDHSLTPIDYEKASEFLPSGKLGMLLCEEWVVEYVDKYADDNSLDRSDIGLTYFPEGPSGSKYIDPSVGANDVFIPSTLSEDRAKAAMAVYSALYAPDPETTKEQDARYRGEELFADDASVNVYTDIISNQLAEPNCIARVGLYDSFKDMCDMFIKKSGTPQSIVATKTPEMQGLIDDSPYTSILAQQGKQ